MKAVLLAGFALLSGHAMADPTFFATSSSAICDGRLCARTFHLASVSETKRYGLLIAAPDSGCRHVRFRVETETKRFLGHTPPLAPGQIAVVRMGQGFAEGDHDLLIVAEGCAAVPALARRVTFGKTSPDHGWRAAPQLRAVLPGVES